MWVWSKSSLTLCTQLPSGLFLRLHNYRDINIVRSVISSVLAGTLGFYLDGVAYPDGSTVLRTDIGEGADALQCTTDSTTCCTNNFPEMRAGEFYMPDGGLVVTLGSTTNGYYRFRGSQHILLNRRSPGTITGQFRCNIPQANGPDVDLYMNIGKYIKFINPWRMHYREG